MKFSHIGAKSKGKRNFEFADSSIINGKIFGFRSLQVEISEKDKAKNIYQWITFESYDRKCSNNFSYRPLSKLQCIYWNHFNLLSSNYQKKLDKLNWMEYTISVIWKAVLIINRLKLNCLHIILCNKNCNFIIERICQITEVAETSAETSMEYQRSFFYKIFTPYLQGPRVTQERIFLVMFRK